MKKETKFRRNYDPDYKGTPHEMDYGDSVTQPSMTLTVRELMTRHTRGLETGAMEREPIYLPDGMEVPRPNDLTDLVYERERLEEQRKELEKTAHDEELQRKEQELEQASESKETDEAPAKPSTAKPVSQAVES